MTAPLSDRLTLNAAVAYTHARYVEYNGLGISGLPLIPPNYGVLLLPTDFDDGEMIRAPDWTGNLRLNYDVPTSSGTWGLSGNYFYTSRVPLSPGAQLSQDAYGLLSLRGSWTSPNGAWTVAVFGNNVTDEEYLIFSGAGFLGNNRIHGAPSSWGAELEFRF